VVSLQHPQALFTVSHAIERNKVLFSLAEAAFIFNTDLKRGETDAINNHLCDWIYAFDTCAANETLVSRGAAPMNLEKLNLQVMSGYWKSSRSEQLSMFDLTDL